MNCPHRVLTSSENAYNLAGAGQEVGKSCVVVTINGKRIMFDCGMHMGYLDHRRYPDFSLISNSCDFTSSLSCVIITHFHLDHIGALPYFTQVCGYNGPIYMTVYIGSHTLVPFFFSVCFQDLAHYYLSLFNESRG